MDFEYKAFISYSHRDTRWAEWLLHALETYRLPESKTRGVGRVFRDRDEAGAGDLRDEIQRALAASETLIVIASPNSARSPYVQAEIDSFVAHHADREPHRHIVTLIIGGEPNASSVGEPDPRECFPPALRGGITLADGTIFEPLAADARAEGDGRTRALAKVVAGLMDIRYDTLVRRDLLRRRRARLLASGAALVTLLVAGAVTAVIVAGNIEQERLRVASEVAAREARTVSTVNDAERARRMLDAGNSADALDLAIRSLPLDGSVPFVPQAYDVLYRSIHDRTQEVDAELAGYHRSSPVVLPAGPRHYLVYNESGTVAIWSVDRGVVYRRSDVAWEQRPTLAPDGSAILVPGPHAMLRLSLPDRIWSTIDVTEVFPDLSMPDYSAMIDASSFYACHSNELLRIAVDEELRGRVGWRVTLPVPCNAMTLTPSGGVAVALGSFGYEFDGKGVGVRLFGPAGEIASERIYAADEAIILSSHAGTSVYRGYDNIPVTVDGHGMDHRALSADGKTFVHTDTDRGGIAVVDLRTGDERFIPCSCIFIGYGANNQLLTAWGRTIEGYDYETLAPLGVVHIFEAEADSYDYLASESLLMALRRTGPESIAFLDVEGSATLLADGTSDMRRGITSAAFTGKHSVLIRELGPDGLQFRLLDASTVHATNAPQRALTFPARFGTAYPLADRSFAIVDLDGGTGKWRVSVHDGDSGDQQWSSLSNADPVLHPGTRYVGASDEKSVTIHDAGSGTSTTHEVVNLLSWRLAGERLIVAYDEGGEMRLSGKTARDASVAPAWSQELIAVPYAMCAAPAADIFYILGWSDDALRLERRSSADGTLLTALVPENTTLVREGDIRPVFDISCDATSLRMSDSLSQQWRWDSAANTLAAEAKTATPPRADIARVGLIEDELPEDGLIGWDNDGSWLYDPRANQIVASFASAGGRVSASAWLPAPGLAVLGFESGRVEVWDARHPSAAMISLESHTAPVQAVDYDPARQQLLTADQEGSIHLWPVLDPEELVAQAAVRSR